MGKASNAEARAFKDLHVPGNPLLLVNVHDVASARLVAGLPQCKALATGSLAVALATGADDDNELTLETQLEATARIATVARTHGGKPLTVDLQDGYGTRLEEAVAAVVGLGAVGINLEDSLPGGEVMGDADAAADRLRRAAATAAREGVEDLVINARADSFFHDGDLDEALRRGKLYLEAGATTVFIIGHRSRECTRYEVERMVRELGGRVNVILRLPLPGRPVPTLTARDLASLGVARVSIGPQLYYAALAGMQDAARMVLEV